MSRDNDLYFFESSKAKKEWAIQVVQLYHTDSRSGDKFFWGDESRAFFNRINVGEIMFFNLYDCVKKTEKPEWIINVLSALPTDIKMCEFTIALSVAYMVHLSQLFADRELNQAKLLKKYTDILIVNFQSVLYGEIYDNDEFCKLHKMFREDFSNAKRLIPSGYLEGANSIRFAFEEVLDFVFDMSSYFSLTDDNLNYLAVLPSMIEQAVSYFKNQNQLSLF